MQLIEVRTEGFRNLPASIRLAAPVAVVVGENNAGKSNLIDALRATLRPLHGYREQLDLDVDDFSQDATSGERTREECRLSWFSMI